VQASGCQGSGAGSVPTEAGRDRAVAVRGARGGPAPVAGACIWDLVFRIRT